MKRPAHSVAEIIRAHAADLFAVRGTQVTAAQRGVLADLAACRTAALGGHVRECTHCGEQQIAYNSCRNRHCPTCLAHKSREWLAKREAELLPVQYFHVVFTVPKAIAALALGNKKAVYGILLAAAAETLRQIGRDPRHLGAEIGFLSILHTWDQKLQHHPHVHCVVPGGGLADGGTRWVPCAPGFFLPVRVLSKVFRGKFLHKLRRARDNGELSFAGCTRELADPASFERFVAGCRGTDWVVYAKPPFGSPAQVLKYLARYTHRVAITNHRILGFSDARVTFRYRISAKDNRQGTMTVAATEFLRRFLLHVLPKGFTRIRAYGLLANCRKNEDLARCRQLLGAQARPAECSDAAGDEPGEDTQPEARTCPACNTGLLVRIRDIEPAGRPWWPDTS